MFTNSPTAKQIPFKGVPTLSPPGFTRCVEYSFEEGSISAVEGVVALGFDLWFGHPSRGKRSYHFSP